MSTYDFIVVGAGMAGASIAYELATDASVLVLESEDTPGYHTTGRSAALYTEAYGNAAIRALTASSRRFLSEPPDGFATAPLLRPRGCVYLAREDQAEPLDALEHRVRTSGVSVERLDVSAMQRRIPLLRPGYARHGLLEPGAMDIDVDALHQGYLRGATARGAVLRISAPLLSVERRDGLWRLATGAGPFSGAVLINAAGAWADAVAGLAGAAPSGIAALLRTAVLVDPPAGVDVRGWPAAIDVEEQFYFKPEAGLLLLSPADESPVQPCDAAPDEYDVAVAVERVQQALDLPVRRVGRAWAGLRSFAPDRTPVVGYDGQVEGFFWLAGQGGYGIQTAPALARTAAALALRRPFPAELSDLGLDAATLSPARFGGMRSPGRRSA